VVLAVVPHAARAVEVTAASPQQTGCMSANEGSFALINSILTA
jgi:hypothetical protein